jgi:voltage-gated potassium channel
MGEVCTADGRSALERWRAATDVPLVVLAVGTLPLLLLEIERDLLPDHDRVFLDVVNLVVLAAFATDYVVELVVAEDRRRHVRTEWASLLIVLAQVIALLPGLVGMAALRGLRGGRALRLGVMAVRLLAVGGAVTRRGDGLLRRHAAGLAIGTAGLTWITAAVAFTLTEDVGEGRRIGSFFDALWWSTCTLTTVGYGDVYPVTGVGRMVGAVTMVVGVAAFAVVTAKVAEVLVRPPADDGRS